MFSDDGGAESRVWSAVLSMIPFGDSHVTSLAGVDTLLVPFTTTSPTLGSNQGSSVSPQCSSLLALVGIQRDEHLGF